MPTRIFLRPMMSLRRGRKRENSAAAVKNQVWDRPMVAWSVLSSAPMVTRAGLSMDALSWKATQASSRATMRAVTLPGLLWFQ